MIHSTIEIQPQFNMQTAAGKDDWRALTQPLPGRSEKSAALAVSSDVLVLREIAGAIRQCGLAVLVGFTVRQSRRILESQNVSLVVCDDRLIDGKYQDIIEAAKLQSKTPVIVVSPTADWPDYLKAIRAGAFDYIAYPPIDGDLPRTIRNALAQQQEDTSDAEDTAGTFFCL